MSPPSSDLRQRIIDSYAEQRYPRLRFSFETVSIEGYGNPPYEFRLRVDIEGFDRYNVLCTQVPDRDTQISWKVLQSMIDSAALWAQGWLADHA